MSLRVLVVDDNVDAVRTAEALLTNEGHVVAIAFSGKQAYHTVGSFLPDVVITDLGMPNMDGLELCRMVRAKHGPQIRMIAVTGWDALEDIEKCKQAGFDAHVVKPLNWSQVHAILRDSSPATQ